jgi:hypothetical protein
VIFQSGDVSPSPKPFSGSLLLTEVIRHIEFPLQLSEAEALTVTGTIL